jgi:hypothetical protein
MTDRAETIMAAFASVARPVMLRFLGGDRQTCIASTRMTIETMRSLGLEAEPVPVQFMAHCRALNFAYISGFSDKARRRMARRAGKPILTRGAGWNGHLIAAVAGRWLVDSSIDQIHSPDQGLLVEPCTMVMPIPEGEPLSLKRLSVEMRGETESGQKLEVSYRSIVNRAYRDSEAWEFCWGMKLAVAAIIEEMTRKVKAA